MHSRFLSRVLRVSARAIHEAGREFFVSDNGVWLTEAVSSAFFERVAVDA